MSGAGTMKFLKRTGPADSVYRIRYTQRVAFLGSALLADSYRLTINSSRWRRQRTC